MSESLKIWISIPPRELSPNARVHWAQKSRAVARYRNEAFLSALEAMGRDKKGFPWPGAILVAEFHFLTKRKRDRDNLAASLKSAIDGFADAGIVKDDNTIRIAGVLVVVGSRRPGVEIELARAERTVAVRAGRMKGGKA